MHVAFRPRPALVHDPEGGVVRANGGVGPQRRLQVGGTVVTEGPSVGGWQVKVGKGVVVQGQPPSVEPATNELDVLPCLHLRGCHRSVGDRFHVAQELRRTGGSVNGVAKHVLHHEVKRVLAGLRGREVHLAVDLLAAACRNTVGEHVHLLTVAVGDGDFNVEIFEKGVGKDPIAQHHRVVDGIPITVGEGRCVQRQGRRRGDAGSLDVDGSGRVGGAARGVIAISHRTGVPRDHPHLVGEVAKSRHEGGRYVVGEVEVACRPQAVRSGFAHHHTVELRYGTRCANGQGSRCCATWREFERTNSPSFDGVARRRPRGEPIAVGFGGLSRAKGPARAHRVQVEVGITVDALV